MCMKPSFLTGSITDAPPPIRTDNPDKDRYSLWSLLIVHAREVALAIMITVYLGQYATEEIPPVTQSQTMSHSFLARSERSALNGAHVVLYALLVKVMLTYPLSRLVEKVREIRDSTSTAMKNVSSCETVSRLRSTVSQSSVRLLAMAGCTGKQHRSLVISAADSFLSHESIVALSLSDITTLFRYAATARHADFDAAEFHESISVMANDAIQAIDSVSSQSLGSINMSMVHREKDGDMDALIFASVIRIFAEWRSLRLIPEGCNHKYSFSMGMARRDLMQNVRKIEDAVHSWVLNQERMGRFYDETKKSPSHSPSLKTILEYELKHGIHQQLPKLAEQSGASGLLWAIRQLKYQTALFSNTAMVPYAFPDSKAAARAAYKATYDKYHGFIARQLFQTTFDAAPEADVVLRSLSVLSDDSDDDAFEESDDDGDWVQFPVDRGISERQSQWEVENRKNLNVLEQTGSFLTNEWMKLIAFVGQCATAHGKGHPSKSVLRSADDIFPVAAMSHNHSISMTVYMEVPSHVHAMQPILESIEEMISNFNMNDPSRV